MHNCAEKIEKILAEERAKHMFPLFNFTLKNQVQITQLFWNVCKFRSKTNDSTFSQTHFRVFRTILKAVFTLHKQKYFSLYCVRQMVSKQSEHQRSGKNRSCAPVALRLNFRSCVPACAPAGNPELRSGLRSNPLDRALYDHDCAPTKIAKMVFT